MNKAYVFRIGPMQFIINAQYSGIGYCYPRVFVQFPDSSYLNCDLYLCGCFTMTENDWFSWLDGTEEYIDTIEEVRKIAQECGFNWDKFETFIFDYLQESGQK